MRNARPFACTDPTLLPILDELRCREPIFHRPEYGSSIEAFDRLMPSDYWEVGASGNRYERSFILAHLAASPPVDSDAAGWKTSDFACRPLGGETYLLTYTLDQNGRITRRSTIWRRNGADWQILFHQGTVVSSSGGGDSAPAP